MLEISRNTLISKLLECDDMHFIDVFDDIIKIFIQISQEFEEFKVELIGNDKITQITIKDLEFNFWIQNDNGTMIYQKGINDNATSKFILSKEQLLEFLQQKTNGFDAYMRGKVKVHGKLTHALNFVKLLSSFLIYMDKNQHNS